MTPSSDQSGRSVAAGMGLTLLLHILAILLAFGAAAMFQDELVVLALASLFLIGVVQLIYMVPAVIIAQVRGRSGVAKGLIIGAAITFALNAACWGLLTASSVVRF